MASTTIEDIFPSYEYATSDGAGAIAGVKINTAFVMIPRSEIGSLSADDAAEDSGDWRELFYHLLAELVEKYDAMDAADQAENAVPYDTNVTMGTTGTTAQMSYSIQYTYTATLAVKDES